MCVGVHVECVLCVEQCAVMIVVVFIVYVVGVDECEFRCRRTQCCFL